QRPWYKELMASDQLTMVSSPYKTTGGSLVISIMVKTFDMEGRPLGMVGMDFDLQKLVSDLELRCIFRTGYLVTLDNQARFLSHGYKTEFGITNNQQATPFWQKVFQMPDGVHTFTTPKGVDKYIVSKTIPELGWKLSVVFDREELLSVSHALIQRILIWGALFFFIALVIILLLANSIISPLERLITAASIISSGEYESSAQIRQQADKALTDKSTGETARLAWALKGMV
ncbi:MAG: cache domain-containing protein, partial [Desulfovibrionaceae bacterium]|nr:cache domain-containing protein [Desulfovibrionaceae bacterium]